MPNGPQVYRIRGLDCVEEVAALRREPTAKSGPSSVEAAGSGWVGNVRVAASSGGVG